jgi:putative redox protein
MHRIDRDISLVGDLSDEDRSRLLDIAERCPVHRTLVEDKEIVSRLV